MHIFTNPDQALRFAFILDEYPGDLASPGLMVRAALHEAGIDRLQLNLNIVPHEQVRAETERIVKLVREGDLLQYERAALIVHYSRNWDDKRAAAAKLAPYFYQGLRNVIDDTKVIDKLVARHYIAERERHGSWALPSIADQFTISYNRILQANEFVGRTARQLETAALGSVRRLLEMESVHV